MLRLRQIAMAARHLEAAGDDLSRTLGLGAPYKDPGVAKYGLDNLVYALGEDFLEIVSPKEPNTSAGRLIDRRGGDCGYMVIVQTDDLEAARDRVRSTGCRIVDSFDRDGAAYTHLHPKDLGCAILSIDRMDPPDRWEWGGPDWRARRSATALGLASAVLETPTPAETAARWSAVLGRPAAPSAGSWRISLDNADLVFRDDEGRGEGLVEVGVRMREGASLATSADDRPHRAAGVLLNLIAA